MKRLLKNVLSGHIREIVFGLEDSLVSTLGAVSGIAIGSADRQVVVLAGVVIVVVEAASMAAGSYLSSKAANDVYTDRFKQDAVRVLAERVSDKESLREMFERQGLTKKDIELAVKAIMRERKTWLAEVARNEYRMLPVAARSALVSGLVMGLFYVGGGVLIVLPYLLLPLRPAFIVATLIGLLALFLLGVGKAKLGHEKPLRSGLEMMAVSATAAILGIIVGRGFSL